jgi:hypothetical protein
MLMAAAGAAVLLLIAAVVWLLRRSRKKASAQVQKSQPALPAAASTGAGELADQGGPQRVASTQAGGDLTAARARTVPQLMSPRHDMLSREVQEIVNKDTELSAGIIHGWLVEEGQQ